MLRRETLLNALSGLCESAKLLGAEDDAAIIIRDITVQEARIENKQAQQGPV
jgi:hypothetical protein